MVNNLESQLDPKFITLHC